MIDRYAKLFSLSENLYAVSSPVLIVAGSLLKDNQTSKVIAQLKLRNISPKQLKAATVAIHPLDTSSRPLGEIIKYQYLDLNTRRDEDFGQKAPIYLPDVATRSFAVTVEEVIFADNTIWSAASEPWAPLIDPKSLSSIGDTEFVKQFSLKYGNDCKNLPLLHEDLWYCTCGAVNRQCESTCHHCRKSLALLQQVNVDELLKERDARVAAKKERTKKIAAISIGVIAVLVIAIIVASTFIYPYYQSHKTVLTVGDHKVEVCEFNYFYCELAATFESYASYIGIDTTVGLDDQKIESGDTTYLGMFGLDISCIENISPNADGVYNLTWAELFADNAMRNAASAYAVYQEAVKAGYELDADAKAEIDGVIDELKDLAADNNKSIDDYIEDVFGYGCDEDGYRQYLKVVKTASNYPSAIIYSDEEINAHYDQTAEEFDNVAFYYYSTGVEEAETSEEFAELDQQAKEAAEKMAAEFDVNSDSVSIYADYTRELLYSLLNEEALDWLFKSATEGEVKLFTTESEYFEDEYCFTPEYIVLKFITREDYNTANYLELSIADDLEEVKKVKSALEADPSEQNFRALILENLGHDHAEGEDHNCENEGLSENQSRYSASTVSKEFFRWIFLEERTAGEWKCFELDGKTVFYFYLGEGEGYRDMCIENILLNEWYEELTKNAIATCNYDKDAAMAANVNCYSN